MKVNELIVKESKLYYLEQMHLDESIAGENFYVQVRDLISELSTQDKRNVIKLLERQLSYGLKS